MRAGLGPGFLFFAAVTLYFTAQVGLRLALGGALETDEAEMMVMTPGLRTGYGPQLPLYNWLQIGLFELFGRSLLALSLLKNGLLWLTYVVVFLGLRLWLPAGTAAIGALSLFLVPDIAWEAQRATTHSNILLACSALTLAAFLWAVRGGRWVAWLALGLAVGLGGLSKYNFWLVPLGLFLAGLSVAPMRGQILRGRTLLVPVLAGAVVAGPYAWMIGNADLAFASLGKLHLDKAAAGPPEGLLLTVTGALALLALPFAVAVVLWFVGRRRAQDDGRVPALLLRAGVLLWLLVLGAVWVAEVGHMTQRWLLPVAFLTVPGLFAWLSPRLGPGALRGFLAVVAAFALTVFAGLSYDRYKSGARRDVAFATLPAALEAVTAPGTPVVAEFYTAGNLKRLRPGWQIAPYLPFAAHEVGDGPVLLLLREDVPPGLESALAQAGWGGAVPRAVLAEGGLSLPYMSSDGGLPLRYVLADMPAPEPRP